MFQDIKFEIPTLQAPIFGKFELMIVILAIIFMEIVHLIERKENMRSFLSKKPLLIRWAVYYILIFAILFFGNFGTQEFIYFQF